MSSYFLNQGKHNIYKTFKEIVLKRNLHYVSKNTIK